MNGVGDLFQEDIYLLTLLPHISVTGHTRLETTWAPRQPTREGASDSESEGDDGIVERSQMVAGILVYEDRHLFRRTF